MGSSLMNPPSSVNQSYHGFRHYRVTRLFDRLPSLTNMNRKTIYAVLGIVFVASLVAAIVLHYFFRKLIVEDLAGVPAILALCGALFQLSTESRHEPAYALARYALTAAFCRQNQNIDRTI